jgi:hypothetical protein
VRYGVPVTNVARTIFYDTDLVIEEFHGAFERGQD